MNAKKIYTYLYKKLDKVTPLKVDCGGLCDGACCKGDEETGMYLFPSEEVMYDGTEDWIKIYDSEFVIEEKPVKIAICNGKCDRSKRPLSCRIFPLFADKEGNVIVDARAKSVCPLVYGDISLEEYDKKFVKNVKSVFNVLRRFKVTKEYLYHTRKIIEDCVELNNIFK